MENDRSCENFSSCDPEGLLRRLRNAELFRKMISCELHDTVAQQVTAALMQLRAFQAKSRPEDADPAGHIAMAMQCLNEAALDIRRLIAGYHCSEFSCGLLESVGQLIDNYRKNKGLMVEFRHAGSDYDNVSPELCCIVMRIVDQSLCNVIRHAETDRATVAMSLSDKVLQVVISDAGKGFCPEEADCDRFGLKSIAHRAELFGGTVKIESTPGAGTTVTVELPLEADDECFVAILNS